MNIIIIYIFLINIWSFISMYIDKKKAIKNQWRISEATFLIYTFLLGGIGVILGMKKFRHKTKHFKFNFFIPFIVIMQIGIIIFLIYNNYI